MGCIVDEMFIEATLFQETFPVLKLTGCAPKQYPDIFAKSQMKEKLANMEVIINCKF